MDALRELATVPAPSFGGRGRLLMTNMQFEDYMAGEGKSLVFNNYFQKIDGNCEYRGQWASDRQNWQGLGEITYNSGEVSRYQGFTKNKLYHGRGRVEYRNGEIYQGEFEKGKRTGRGTVLSNTEDG